MNANKKYYAYNLFKMFIECCADVLVYYRPISARITVRHGLILNDLNRCCS